MSYLIYFLMLYNALLTSEGRFVTQIWWSKFVRGLNVQLKSYINFRGWHAATYTPIIK